MCVCVCVFRCVCLGIVLGQRSNTHIVLNSCQRTEKATNDQSAFKVAVDLSIGCLAWIIIIVLSTCDGRMTYM